MYLKLVTLALFWQACASKINKIEDQLLTNIDIKIDYRNGIRRGIAKDIFHYAEANIKYSYDKKKQNINTCIRYLDFNNQNRWT